MFDIAPSEFILLGIVALLVIPPKDLPKAMRVAGYWVNKLRGVARQFRSGFDTMVRESELQDMEKRWAAENERIMREHPPKSSQMTSSQMTSSQMTSSQMTGAQMLPIAPPPPEDGDAAAATVEMPVVAPADVPATTGDKSAS